MADRPAADVAAFLAAFPYHREREVEFGDIDLLQHVNNVRHAVWAETLRVTYFADVFGTRIDGPAGVIIARHDMHYEAQLVFRERVVIGCRVARWGNKSFDLETEIWSLTHGRRVFRSTAVFVAYDYDARASFPIPDVWRRAVPIP
jgi:acyl-CoA thioester hydrolase